jgi:catechol-2,3-dioxygenase
MSRSLDTKTPVKPAYFAHFVVRVRDLERSIAWYQTALGMEIVHRNPMIAFMTYDEEHHRLALAQTPVEETAPPGCVGVDHVAYSFGELGELLAHYVRLKEVGIKPVWPINHGPTTSLYYEDPDGNRIEFQVDNFDNEAELKGWMSSEAFKENPIGVQFDPDKLVARYEQGDPIEELVKQGSA